VATNGSFSLVAFAGETPWAEPHVHRGTDESMYVLDGRYVVTVADREIAAQPGDFLFVPRSTPHVVRPEGPGRLLMLMVPGGLEEMYRSLSSLTDADRRDPAVEAEVCSRFDTYPAG
jgi:hypothetical protein